MIVLDTNVVSELLRTGPSSAVVAWFERQADCSLYLTAPGLSEMLTGVAAMAPGQRRMRLADGIRQLVETELGTPVLPFDEHAAAAYAALSSRARARGQTIAILDAQIAAIAATAGFAVATRDVTPFLVAGVPVIDPWRPFSI